MHGSAIGTAEEGSWVSIPIENYARTAREETVKDSGVNSHGMI